MPLSGALAQVLRSGAFQLPQLRGPPDLGDILLVIERLDGAANVGAHATLIVPEGTRLVEEIESVVGEEVGGLGQVVEGWLDLRIQAVESSVGCTCILDNGFGRNL